MFNFAKRCVGYVAIPKIQTHNLPTAVFDPDNNRNFFYYNGRNCYVECWNFTVGKLLSVVNFFQYKFGSWSLTTRINWKKNSSIAFTFQAEDLNTLNFYFKVWKFSYQRWISLLYNWIKITVNYFCVQLSSCHLRWYAALGRNNMTQIH